MNDDIARALLEVAETFTRVVVAMSDDPNKNSEYLILLIGAIQTVVEKYNANTYEETDREVVRSLIDLAMSEVAATVVVTGTVVLLAPAAGVVAIAVSTLAVGTILSGWMSSASLSFYPSLQDASQADGQVSLYGYNGTGDTLISSRYSDVVFGLSGGDYVENLGGSDIINGGSGYDHLSYSRMSFSTSNGITVDARNGNAGWSISHGSGVDTVSEIEELTGTSAADTFVVDNSGGNNMFNDFLRVVHAEGGDDVVVLHNGGTQGPRQLALYGGSHVSGDTLLIGDDGFNTQIDLAAGTARFNGGSNASFSVIGFEHVQGTNDSDLIIGNESNNRLDGAGGSDALFGGAGDDTLSFYGSANLDGGAGFDVVDFTLKEIGDFVDASAASLEVVLGGSGSDTLAAGGSELTFLSGGSGNDTFNISTTGGSPVIVWGGGGADLISLETNGSDPAGIVVVNSSNISEENFHLVDIESLGLGSNFDWSQIDVVVFNPDAADRVNLNGVEIEVEITPQPIIRFYQDEDGVTIREHYGSLPPYLGWQGAGEIEFYDQNFLDGYSGRVFAPAEPYFEFFAITEYRSEDGTTYVGLLANGEDGGVNLPPLAQGLGLGGSGYDGEIDTEYNLGGAAFVSQWTTADGSYGSREHFFYRQDPLETIEAATGWFIAGGGSFEGVVLSGGINYLVPEPTPGSGAGSGSSGGGGTPPPPRGGSYHNSSGASNLSGGEETRRLTSFNASQDTVVISGVALNGSNLASGVTAYQSGGSTVIAYGTDDNVVLRGVTLAQWQAGASVQILGGAGADSLTGTGGANVFAGGGGADTISAGAGNDRINYASGNDVILGHLSNAGTDTLDLRRFTARDVTFRVSGQDVLITTADGTIRLGSQIQYDLGNARSNIETILLRNRSLTETDIRARAVSDQATDGNDSITGTAFADVIDGLAGKDTINASGGNDTIAFSGGHDVILGHLSNAGSDTVDLQQYMASEVSFRVSGQDVLITTAAGTITLGSQLQYAVGNARSNIETVVFANGGLTEAGIMARAVSDQATSGNDSIVGTGWADVINGLGGNDTLSGFAGNDTFGFTSGDDVIVGHLSNFGVDTLDLTQYSASNVTFRVSGLDVLVTTAQGTIRLESQVRYATGHERSNIETILFNNGTLNEAAIRERAVSDQATAGANTITGTGQADIIRGLAGNDTITGGAGADIFVFARGDGADRITDFSRSGGDVIRFHGLTYGDLTISQSGSNAIVHYGSGNVLTLASVTASTLTAAAFEFL